MSTSQRLALVLPIALLAILLGLGWATQQTAHGLHYAAALGPGWADVGPVRLYRPWAFVQWYLALPRPSRIASSAIGSTRARRWDVLMGTSPTRKDAAADGLAQGTVDALDGQRPGLCRVTHQGGARGAADLADEPGFIRQAGRNLQLLLAERLSNPQVVLGACGPLNALVDPLDLALQRAPLAGHVSGSFQLRAASAGDIGLAGRGGDPRRPHLHCDLGPFHRFPRPGDRVQLGVFGPDHPRRIADPLHQGEPFLPHPCDPLFGLPKPKFRGRQVGAGRL